TIRYYEEIGLIPEAQRNQSGFRVYSQAEIDRLAFILRARALDFSLDDIGEILALREQGEAPCLYVTELVQQRIAEIDAKISALNQLRRELEEVQQTAQALPDENILNKDCICHLIENRALANSRV
ncbi:MAG TPA: MerR family DNA-binding protein, partial [Anaerolineales bacterium]|nr:MerR family DNA-binding protein [Anaerolineales bacterium]